ncbi:ABC transporter substrate-binding protein [Aquitalea sp. LB_tupeE]|uniref:substrate-binding periplasmic protein n=1 Tax=Aquitalea sp. LB_tupeE TaxID=2748078 RepID=UPI0015BE8195|nr:ABC transporter substrate-binding protein [Aquitalea sp. LB_tupeE]NWK79575.1 ABC transporter substrate-binding protein [Aquitalea sp. LB_tupeE]
MSLPSLMLRLGLLFGAVSAWAGPGKQTLDLECDYLPKICNQKEDATPGLMIEIGSEAIRRAGYVPNVKIRPWVRAMREVLASPDALIIYFARTPEREPLFNWIVVTNTTDFRFFTRNGAEPCNTLQQAINRGLIGVRSGSSIRSWLTQQGVSASTLVEGQLPEMAKMLNAGRIGSFLGASITFNQTYQVQHGNLPTEGAVVYSSQSWLASGPRFSPAIAARLAKAINDMKQDGFYEQTMRKYMR